MKPSAGRAPRILVVLGDGGHTAEILELVARLGPEYRYDYALSSTDQISERKITLSGPVWRLTRPRAKDEPLIPAAWHFARSLLEAARVVLRARPDAVLGSGPALLVPLAVTGKLLRAKVIFVETGSRVTELSLTGKIMLRLADQFFVQWEPLHARYPRTIFAGRLL
jgi:UDP-N-acetylglucosamine:LPS N-acetylglucosamine transferase